MKSSLKKLLEQTQKSLWSIREKMRKIKEPDDENALESRLEKILDSLPGKEQTTFVHLSGSSIARATAIVIILGVLAFLLYEIREILLILFISLLFAAALDPAVDKLEKYNFPRSLSMVLIYIGIFIILGIFISQLIPLVAAQTIELGNKIGVFISNISSGNLKIPFSEKVQPVISQFLEGIDQQTIIDGAKSALLKIGEQLQNVAGNAWKALKIIFNGVFNVILVLFITFFLVTDHKQIEHFIRSMFSSKYEEYIIEKTNLIKSKIGSWLRGQLLLVFSIGILTFIGLSILDVEYAATLAMIAGIMELIPVIGPILASIPAILIAANSSGWMVLWVIILYIVIQQLENNILVPVIMKKAVGIHPVVVIIAMLIGNTFLGIIGVIIAIPVASTLSIFVNDYSAKKK